MARQRRRKKNRQGYVSAQYSVKQLRALAARLAKDTLAPQQRELRNQSENDAASITSFTKALADTFGGVGSGISEDYRQAAETQGALGQGFADGMRMLQEQESGKTNAFLGDVVGAPAGKNIQSPPDASNVLYGLGGFGPASTLNREGAAFSAAARQLPATAARQGQQDLSQSLAINRAKMSELDKTRPGLQRQILQDLLARELDKAGYRINAGALGASVTANEQDFALGQGNLALGSAGLAQDAAEFEAGQAQDAAEGRSNAPASPIARAGRIEARASSPPSCRSASAVAGVRRAGDHG